MDRHGVSAMVVVDSGVEMQGCSGARLPRIPAGRINEHPVLGGGNSK